MIGRCDACGDPTAPVLPCSGCCKWLCDECRYNRTHLESCVDGDDYYDDEDEGDEE